MRATGVGSCSQLKIRLPTPQLREARREPQRLLPRSMCRDCPRMQLMVAAKVLAGSGSRR